MFELLGVVCVGWTIFELARLGQSAARVQEAQTPTGSTRAGASGTRSRVRRFAAWDERGKRIVVEDLGGR
jgi:hypothetical protein